MNNICIPNQNLKIMVFANSTVVGRDGIDYLINSDPGNYLRPISVSFFLFYITVYQPLDYSGGFIVLLARIQIVT